MSDYVKRLLGDRYEVMAVFDGTTALAAALASPPDLVLTDIMMPGLDGFALLRALRADERTRTIPVILLSARAGEESAVAGLEIGADDYLVSLSPRASFWHGWQPICRWVSCGANGPLNSSGG
jgi:DNA-binding response OmpR family regulator